MDNICHTLVGGALSRAGFDRLSPLALPTMLIAANLPDVDIISALWGDLAYLEYHRGVTHSVAGMAIEAPLLAGAMVLADRVTRAKGSVRAPARFTGLVIVALVGLASHLLLDWTNSYGVRPWLPFDGAWVYGDIAFVIDPWLWLVLGGALFLGAVRTRITMAMWSVLFAVMAIGVVGQQLARQADSGGSVAAWIWLGLLVALVVMRSVWPVLPARRLATGSLVAVVAYWGALAGLRTHAGNIVADGELPDVTPPITQSATIPTFMRPDRWIVLRATSSEISESTVTLVSKPYVTGDVIPRNLDDAAVTAALQSCPGEVAEGFNRFLYAEIVPDTRSGERTVLLRDARFGGIPGRYGFATTRVVVDANLRYVPDGRPCPRLVLVGPPRSSQNQSR